MILTLVADVWLFGLKHHNRQEKKKPAVSVKMLKKKPSKFYGITERRNAKRKPGEMFDFRVIF